MPTRMAARFCDHLMFVKSLTTEQDKRFSSRCLLVSNGSNELVVDFEDPSDDLFLIISGNVRVILRISTGREVILGEFSDGEFFGELSAVDGETRSANVTAMVNTKLLRMPRSVFLEILRDVPDVALDLMQSMSQLIRAQNTRLAEHTFLAAKYRLYAELLRLSRPRKGYDDQRSITPPPIQQSLAERIGCRREVVSREIAKLERENVVERTRGALILLDIRALNARLSEGWNAGSD